MGAALLVAAAILAALAAAAWLAPPVVIAHRPVAVWWRAFVAWLPRPGAAAVLAFVLLYNSRREHVSYLFWRTNFARDSNGQLNIGESGETWRALA